MKAARIHRFGAPDAIAVEDVPCPRPAAGEILVRVANAGVGPWDAWIREGTSVVKPSLPLTLGSDLSGFVESVGSEVTAFRPGDEVFGVTNPEFIGAYAQFALAKASMIAQKPASLSFAEAASAPVVAVTAWQMLFDYAEAKAGQTVLILGAGGSVGAYAVQFAAQAGLHVTGTASASDTPYLRSLGVASVIDYRTARLEEHAPPVDIVLDMVGGDTMKRSLEIIEPGGILVSVVSEPGPLPTDRTNIRAVFFLVDVTKARLERIAALFDGGKLVPRVGTVLPLEKVRTAHDMLAGSPHAPGKIVLSLREI